MNNKGGVIVCADCKAGHSVLIPWSGLLPTQHWPFHTMTVYNKKTFETDERNRVKSRVKELHIRPFRWVGFRQLLSTNLSPPSRLPSCPWPAAHWGQGLLAQMTTSPSNFIHPASCLLNPYLLFYPPIHGGPHNAHWEGEVRGSPLRPKHEGGGGVLLYGADLVSHSPPWLKPCSWAQDTCPGSH